ncbi:16S rRNA (cytosine(1402)-N(4))-methyltransferase RsmH [bacterium]|nr:16S rRNA (cytosine(1402)-N(4))-methyltransferase RsmH [bacterium]
MMSNYHVPVMLGECMEGLAIKPDGVYVDATYGGGGHAREILKRLNDKGTLLVFDQDSDAVKNRADDPRLKFCNANFRYLQNFCSYYRLDQIDGLLADLGVSSHQFDEEERGFSFRFSGADLDMRMNEGGSLSAVQVLNEYNQQELTSLLKKYGEVKRAGAIAKSIVAYRQANPIEKTDDLEAAVKTYLNPNTRNKQLAQIYQAVRIEVNGEIDALVELLEQSAKLIKPEGRLVVMSYHSLEDRLVKNMIQSGSVDGERRTDAYGNPNLPFKAINRKPITASEAELERNPRSRSAKLRIAVRT